MTLEDVEFELDGTMDEADEIMRCLRNLLLTPAGTVPLDRDFGLNNSFLGLPIDTAQSVLAVEMMDKVDKYEPRVSVKEVELIPTAEGKITAKVVITSG